MILFRLMSMLFAARMISIPAQSSSPVGQCTNLQYLRSSGSAPYHPFAMTNTNLATLHPGHAIMSLSNVLSSLHAAQAPKRGYLSALTVLRGWYVADFPMFLRSEYE